MAGKKIGIVGSRRRTDKNNVIALVDSLDLTDTIVSGGCKGVDTWAEERAKQRGMKTIIHKPDLKNVKDRIDVVKRYYERNKKVAQESDIIHAFVSNDRKGGTENTIQWSLKMHKIIIIHNTEE